MAESPKGQHHKRTATNDYSRERERDAHTERERERDKEGERECVNGLDPRLELIL